MTKLCKHIDCLGILHLRKIPKPIKEFITKSSKSYFSRNELYYESKPLYKISELREKLLSCLCNSKFVNYIIFDYTINFSAQVYYFLMSSKAKTDLIQQALDCLQEDVNNMVALIENRKHYSLKHTLPQNDSIVKFRNIELDNKLELYSYVKSFGKSNFTFISPGLGSILIAPFFKSIWGNSFKHILYSRFKNKDNLEFNMPKNLGKNLYLIDDNIGSGFTTQELITLLKNHNLLGTSAIEYDWYLYDIISKGLSPYTKFNYAIYDKISLLNTRNHKFLDQAIEILKKEPKSYNKYLKQNNFNQHFHNDLTILFNIGKNIAKQYLPTQVYNKALFFTKQIIEVYKGV